MAFRGEICDCRHCRRQCKIFASGVNFSIFTHFLCFFPLKLLKLGEIDGVKFLTFKSGSVNFWTNSMSDSKDEGRLWPSDHYDHNDILMVMMIRLGVIQNMLLTSWSGKVSPGNLFD